MASVPVTIRRHVIPAALDAVATALESIAHEMLSKRPASPDAYASRWPS